MCFLFEILLWGMSHFKEKGVALYLVLVIMGILLAAVLGLSAALIGQIKTIKGIGHSVKALYAADTGIEQALLDVIPSAHYPKIGINGAFYEVWVVCCAPGELECLFEVGGCPLGAENEDPDCPARYFCYKSVGTHEKTKRAIEITR